jgi:hypothetical protein
MHTSSDVLVFPVCVCVSKIQRGHIRPFSLLFFFLLLLSLLRKLGIQGCYLKLGLVEMQILKS